MRRGASVRFAATLAVALTMSVVGTHRLDGWTLVLYAVATAMVLAYVLMGGLPGVDGLEPRIQVSLGASALVIGLSWWVSVFLFPPMSWPGEDNGWALGFGLTVFGVLGSLAGLGFLVAARAGPARAARGKDGERE